MSKFEFDLDFGRKDEIIKRKLLSELITENELDIFLKELIGNESLHTKRDVMTPFLKKNLKKINSVLEKTNLSVEERCGLVEFISMGHGNIKKGHKNITRETSFASKFCSYFNWDFPKYDSLVKGFLNSPSICNITGYTVNEHDYKNFLLSLEKLNTYLFEENHIEEKLELEVLDYAIYRYIKNN